MALHLCLLLLLSFLMLSLAWLCQLYLPHHCLSHSRAREMHLTVHRLLKPRTPLDCPACRLSSTLSSGVEPAPLPVRPWREVKSRRGAPKLVNTDGFACPNHQCPYFGITDAHVHALVGDGKHGLAERIQTFRCQACHTTFSARHDTPLYRLKTPSHQIAVVLAALAEGLDPSAAERVFGYRHATIITWLSRTGEHAQSLHEHYFCNLQLPHLQLDELRTRLRSSTHVLWLCYARKRASFQRRTISSFLWEWKYAQRLTYYRKASKDQSMTLRRESDGSSKPECLSGQSRHGES